MRPRWLVPASLSLFVLCMSTPLAANKTVHGESILMGMKASPIKGMVFASFARMSSEDFFEGIKASKESNGIVFRKNGELVLAYPNTIYVEVHATINRARNAAEAPLAPEMARVLDSSEFTATWKTANHNAPVKSMIVRVSPPRVEEWGKVWIFFIKITDEAIPLSEKLEITAKTGDGETWGRFTGSLD